jgi:hypothetical protein
MSFEVFLFILFIFGLILFIKKVKHSTILSLLGCALMTPFVLMLVVGGGWFALMMWGEWEKQKGANVNNCETIEAYEIDLNASAPYDIPLSSETFNDSLTPTKMDTVLALKKAYNCD